MRRQIIILLSIVLLALPVVAQDWPDSFIGDQMSYQEAQPIQMYMLNWHDRNPWGMIDMTGHFFYFGSLMFDYCYGENMAFLDLDTMAMRHCIEPAYGTIVPPQCFFYASRGIALSYALTWDEEAGAYLVIGDTYWGTSIIALILDGSGESGVIQMGVMNLSSSGVMVWNDSYTHYTYVFEPFTAESMLPRPKRPSIRRMVIE